ncbi:cortex morphogenetic protein CmpA [Peribacillus sp. SCS-155]
MPTWIKLQLAKAFSEKNIYEIKSLNQSWMHYQRTINNKRAN